MEELTPVNFVVMEFNGAVAPTAPVNTKEPVVLIPRSLPPFKVLLKDTPKFLVD